MPARYRVNITRRASSDLREIEGYIEGESPGRAQPVIEDLIQAIDRLEMLPHRHPVYAVARRPMPGVRRMPFPPYLIYYRVNDAARVVDVIAIRHGRRRQPRSFR